MADASILLIVVQILILAFKSGAKVPAIIVFGDSVVDTGNNNDIPTIGRSNFNPYGRNFPGDVPTGRFSNGRLIPDFVSEYFNLKSKTPAYLNPMYNISDFATGVSFASSATGFDNISTDVFKVISLLKQLEYYKDYQHKLKAYLGLKKAHKILSEALYTVTLRTNDFLNNYYTIPRHQSRFALLQFQDFLVGTAENFFKQLYHLGARKVLFVGLPPIGYLPLLRNVTFQDPRHCNGKVHNVTLEFNPKLKNLMSKLNKELPGVRIVFADFYNIASELLKNPSRFGFEVADAGCCGTGRVEASFLCNQSTYSKYMPKRK